MPQSLASLLIHIIFSTKDRLPFIDAKVEGELYRYLSSVFVACESPALKIGGTTNHVHILCRLSRARPLSDVIEKVKTSSSKWIKMKGATYRKFFWQNGYAAFSIGQSGVSRLISYMETQKEHHKKRSFQDELRAFLRNYDVAYDERYLWD